jgi:hypothetical protein
MDGHEVTEYAVRNQDGHWQIRVTRPGEPYPASQWARDQQALGARVLRRRVIVVDDWNEMRLAENT